jgi:hypothetical protein
MCVCHPDPLLDPRKCQHENFHADVKVGRILKADNDKEPSGYMADIRVRCTQCNTPFVFVGVEAGLLFTKPMASPDGQELRAPLRPKNSEILPALPGFTMKAN